MCMPRGRGRRPRAVAMSLARDDCTVLSRRGRLVSRFGQKNENQRRERQERSGGPSRRALVAPKPWATLSVHVKEGDSWRAVAKAIVRMKTRTYLVIVACRRSDVRGEKQPKKTRRVRNHALDARPAESRRQRATFGVKNSPKKTACV
jgi:hypothetical protein